MEGPAASIGIRSCSIAVVALHRRRAQQAPAWRAPAASATSAESLPGASAVRLLVGRSTIINVGTPITRVSLTSPDIADALVTAPGQLLIHGKVPGTISMFVWDKTGAIRTLRGQRAPRPGRLVEQMQQLFPGETIDVQSNGKDVVLSGSVSSKDVARRPPTSPPATSIRRKTSSTCCRSAGSAGVEPGAAARPLRRGEPQRPAPSSARRSSPAPRVQEPARPRHDPAVPRAVVRPNKGALGDGARRSATT